MQRLSCIVLWMRPPLLFAFGVWTDTPQLAHKSFGVAASVSRSQMVVTSSKRISYFQTYSQGRGWSPGSGSYKLRW